MLEYKELMDQAGKTVVPEDANRLKAEASKKITDAQISYRNDPIARKYEKLLHPEIDFDAYYSKQSAPSAKSVSYNDMPKRP